MLSLSLWDIISFLNFFYCIVFFICSIRLWDFLRVGDSLFWQLWRKKMKVSEPPGTFHWPVLLLSFMSGPGRDLCGTTALVPKWLCKVGLNPGTERSLCHLGLCCLSKVLEAVLPLTVKAGDCCTSWRGARLEKCLLWLQGAVNAGSEGAGERLWGILSLLSQSCWFWVGICTLGWRGFSVKSHLISA